MRSFRFAVTAVSAAAVLALTGCGSSSPAKAPVDSVGKDGTYVVGVDVLAGDYTARTPEKGVDPLTCTWTISKDGAILDDQGADKMPDRVVTLVDGQSFTTAHCGAWLPVQ